MNHSCGLRNGPGHGPVRVPPGIPQQGAGLYPPGHEGRVLLSGRCRKSQRACSAGAEGRYRQSRARSVRESLLRRRVSLHRSSICSGVFRCVSPRRARSRDTGSGDVQKTAVSSRTAGTSKATARREARHTASRNSSGLRRGMVPQDFTRFTSGRCRMSQARWSSALPGHPCGRSRPGGGNSPAFCKVSPKRGNRLALGDRERDLLPDAGKDICGGHPAHILVEGKVHRVDDGLLDLGTDIPLALPGQQVEVVVGRDALAFL